MSEKIIFLLGLPRSGTTLLQRILTAHSDITSVAEPWLLLPMLTCFDENINLSCYGHSAMNVAISDLKKEHPLLEKEYDEHVRSFVSKIYEKLRGDSVFFIDKTPRYYLISQKLRNIFTESIFIYLFRNPVDVIDSSIKTFCSNRLYGLPFIYHDLSQGSDLLCKSVKTGGGKEFYLSYEALCLNPEESIREICMHLGLTFESSMISNFHKVYFKGGSGDPKREQHNGISSCSYQKNPISFFRRKLYLNLIMGISDSALATSGYEKDNLIKQIKSRPNASIFQQVDDFMGYYFFRFAIFCGFVFLLNFSRKRRFPPSAFLY